MGSRIETKLLGELASDARGISYGIVQPGPDTFDGVPIVRVCDINGDGINTANLKRVSSEIAARYFRTCLRGGELLVSVVGTPGLCVIAGQELKGSNLARAIAMVPIEDELLTRWCRYQILSSAGQQYIEQCLNTTVQKTLNLKELAAMPIPVPSREVMAKSIHLLDTIERLACANQRANDYLAAMCSALFDKAVSDSADFEPLGNHLNVTSGKRPPIKAAAKSSECQVPIYGASALMGFTSKALTEDRLLVIGRVGTHGVVQRVSGPAWPSDNTLIISAEYYETAFQMLQRVDYTALNRGSTQPLITQKDLKEYEVPRLSNDVLQEFERRASGLMALFDHNIAENTVLAQYRDALLPKLMSGELDVRKVVAGCEQLH